MQLSAAQRMAPVCPGAHDWQSPHSVVGGSADNPGVWSHGGGVVILEVCSRCGIYRRTDTWATDRYGRQGAVATVYEARDAVSMDYVAAARA